MVAVSYRGQEAPIMEKSTLAPHRSADPVDEDRNGLVYRPQDDTSLLIDALRDIDLRGARTVDLCSGSGAVAVSAALGGAAVTAVDSCPRAIAATSQAAATAGVILDVVCADLADIAGQTFDLITCNPPYVPTPPGTELSAPGPNHAWNAGPDGRDVLDVVCALIPGLLADRGAAFIVQSALAGGDQTVTALRAAGLRASVVRERAIAFGPVLRSRRKELVDAGLLDPTTDLESIVVIRADRTADSQRGGRHER